MRRDSESAARYSLVLIVAVILPGAMASADDGGSAPFVECGSVPLPELPEGRNSYDWSFEPMIIGGGVARADAWPFAVALMAEKHATFKLECGATLVAERWVLTAAHCRPLCSDWVVVGTQDLSQIEKTHLRAITSIYEHPNHEDSTLSFDAVLIQLDHAAAGPWVTLAHDDTAVAHGQPSTVLGWGLTESGSTSDKLLQADLELMSTERCEDAFDSLLGPGPGPLYDSMICARAPRGGKGVCNRDSGGPLMVRADGTDTQVGIASWIVECGDSNPQVFTRVSAIRDWVCSIVGDKGACQSDKGDR